MGRLNKIVIILTILLQGTNSFSNNIDSVLSKANLAYKESNFTEASALYQSIVDSGYHSAEIYYNIGNTFFKQNDFPRAILNYERALLLNPTDEDINFNLEKSRTFVVDKIEVIPEFFIKTWIKNTIVILSSDTWALFAVILFIVSVSGFLFFFLTNKTAVKKLVFSFSVLFTLSFLLFGFFSIKSKNYIKNSQSAIVMTQTVTVKSSPDREGMDVFIIHEGCKVSILRKLAGWCEVRIADGKQGWLEEDEIEKI
jgi:tetratricopeptide (TPR) repeat protein